jgi:multicomponent Na+:H+ antiporter subunit B
MTTGNESPIIVLVGRALVPFIQLFGFYVIAHGHYGPGGGFQGGAILASSVLLMRLTVDPHIAELQFRKVMGLPVGVAGALVFVLIGMVGIMLGGGFLDYSLLPFPGFSPAELRSVGILLVEAGIGLAVMATLVSIFDSLAGE